MHRSIGTYCILEPESSETEENNELPTGTSGPTDNVFDLSTNTPTNIFKLNNAGDSDDWRNDKSKHNQEISKDIVKVYNEVEKLFQGIFHLITMQF